MTIASKRASLTFMCLIPTGILLSRSAESPLFWSSRNVFVNICQYLVDCSADVAARDKFKASMCADFQSPHMISVASPLPHGVAAGRHELQQALLCTEMCLLLLLCICYNSDFDSIIHMKMRSLLPPLCTQPAAVALF